MYKKPRLGTAKFGGLEPQRYEDITENHIMAPEIGPESLGTIEKKALGRAEPLF